MKFNVKAITETRNFDPNVYCMKILPIVNTLLILGFLAVITGTFAMIAYVGYNDQLSHTCFILHSVNFFLLVLRAAIR